MALSINPNVSAIPAPDRIKMAGGNQFQAFSRLNSVTQLLPPDDDAGGRDAAGREAAGRAGASQYHNAAAIVTISDEAKQKLAEYNQGTINNAAESGKVSEVHAKDAAQAREAVVLAQLQTMQQAGAPMLAQANGWQGMISKLQMDDGTKR